MNTRYLTILEVSGKQNYIFSSNKLKDNVLRSEEIAYMTSSKGIQELVQGTNTFQEAANYVYAGGGHTILEFSDSGAANAFARTYTKKIHEIFPEAELFVKTIPYDKNLTPGDNLNELTKALEKKKSVREASFCQGSFGIEKINSTTLDPERVETQQQKAWHSRLARKERDTTRSMMPAGYRPSYRFEELGGSRDDSNFIAVVHIDGNGMGKRVNDFYKSVSESSKDDKNPGATVKQDNDLQRDHNEQEWKVFKKKVREFSEGIADDFTDAFRQMNDTVDKAIKEGRLKDLDLSYNQKYAQEDEDEQDRGKDNFPVRRIITSGDDICFVSEGRIGIACAKAFIEALHGKTNKADGKGYNACAGVAIVHVKYPFFRAYDLAESLCSNAKRYGASISRDENDNGQSISSIDWHIEQGEIGDTLQDIRQQYAAADGTRLELRPYILSAKDEVFKDEPNRRFEQFEKVLSTITAGQDKAEADNARSNLKTLRNSLLQGRNSTEYYLSFHQLNDIVRKCYIGNFIPQEETQIGRGKQQAADAYVSTYENGQEHPVQRSILYDAIEIMDTYLPLERRQPDAD